MSGRYINPDISSGGSRPNCGQIRGIKKSKSSIGKPKPIINSCGKLQCNICYREASSIKSNKVLDHFDSIMYYLMFKKVRFTRSYNRNIDFGHYSLNLAPIKKGARDWSHLLPYFENYETFVKKILNPIKKIVKKYFLGAFIELHLFRFVDKERTVLYFSPHFHIVGIGCLPKSRNFSRRYNTIVAGRGINYWKMQNKKTGHYLLASKKDINNCLKYIMSHAGLFMYDQKRKKRQSEQEKKDNDPVVNYTVKASKIAYFYVNIFSPQKFKIVKEFKYKVTEKDELDLPYYELIDGFVLKATSKNGVVKTLLPADLRNIDEPLNFYINNDTEIFLDHDRLKFGVRIKRKKRLKVLIRR
jgi:hypothetical protein